MPILLLVFRPVPPKFTGESARANKAQRQTDVDVLRALFDLVLAPLQQVAREVTVMDCADGKNTPLFSHFVSLDRGSYRACSLARNRQQVMPQV